MAERTKFGYIYIISNIGSFGDDVVKIRLTRRLDPAGEFGNSATRACRLSLTLKPSSTVTMGRR